MKRESVFRRLLAVAVAVALLAAMALPALAAQGADVSFKKVDNSSVSAKLPGRNPADLSSMEDAYADTDVVRVSILLDKAGTIQAGYSPEKLTSFGAKLYRNGLKNDQLKLVNKIEKTTGEALDVVWNLTLAANLISANVTYGQIKEIEALSGVDSVVIETRYEPDVVSSDAADPNMVTSGKQIGSAPAWTAGYTGAGSRIAIIDTGVDTDHQSFSAAAYEAALVYNAGKAGVSVEEYKASLNLLTAEEIDKVAADLNAPVTGAAAYINSKIPFGYNYVDGDYDVTETTYFNVLREGSLDFERIPVDASTKMPDTHMDAVEPFDYSELKPFSTAYLPGFLADKYDVSQQDSMKRIQERAQNSIQAEMRDTVVGYHMVSTQAEEFNFENKGVKYALLPVWMLSTKWKGQSFLFAMNGQTGKLIGDLPVDKGKFWRLFAAIAAPLAAVLSAIWVLM